jgi:endonuclease YncB( thermonuclease family)
MRQLITTAGGLAALALYAGILMSGAETIRNGESAATPEFVLETPEAATSEELPLQEEAPADAVGDGSGAGGEAASPAPVPDAEIGKGSRVAARPIESGVFALPENGVAKPLERVAPRPPLSKPPEEEKPATTVYRRPVALAAGLVRSDDKTLQIKDIEPQSAEKMCDGNGKSWPCGMIARTAFRNFLRARALVCDASEEAGGTLTAHCTVGGRDVAEWLVSNGWALPLPGTALEAKAEAARSAKLGFYGDDPRDLRRTPLALDAPAAGITLEGAAPDL